MEAIGTGVGIAVRRFWPDRVAECFVVVRLPVHDAGVTMYTGTMSRERAIEELLNIAAQLEQGAPYETVIAEAGQTNH